MRTFHFIALIATSLFAGCGTSAVDQPMQPDSLAEKQSRRAFHGAPPVIPHPPLTGACVTCHDQQGGKTVVDVGIAPANPHLQTAGMSDQSRCKQCHVFRTTQSVLFASDFSGLKTFTDSEKAHSTAPPTIPHDAFMRESCASCHTGTAAPPEIVCAHASRVRCTQCHVHVNSNETSIAGIETPDDN